MILWAMAHRATCLVGEHDLLDLFEQSLKLEIFICTKTQSHQRRRRRFTIMRKILQNEAPINHPIAVRYINTSLIFNKLAGLAC